MHNQIVVLLLVIGFAIAQLPVARAQDVSWIRQFGTSDFDLAGDIAAEFPISWASVSRHLQVLRDAGLVLATREGQYIRYSLNTTVLQDAVSRLADLTAGRRRRKGDPDA